MLDLKGIFPVGTAFIAFIITLLCLFAGTQKNILDNADLLTVSASTPVETATIDHNFLAIHPPSKLRNSPNLLFGPRHDLLPGHSRIRRTR